MILKFIQKNEPIKCFQNFKKCLSQVLAISNIKEYYKSVMIEQWYWYKNTSMNKI